jgi:hypothetical protein
MLDKNTYLQNLDIFQKFCDFAIDVSNNTAGLKVPIRISILKTVADYVLTCRFYVAIARHANGLNFVSA